MESIKRRSFEKSIQVRIDEELYERLFLLVNEEKEIYSSVSHFVRSAIIEKLRGKK